MSLRRKLASAAAVAAVAASMAIPAAASADPDVACAGDGTIANGANQTQVEASILCLVNRYRQDNGRTLLSNDTRLASASRSHSVDMNTSGYFAHNDPSDPLDTPSGRATLAGYFAGVGENIAMNGGIGVTGIGTAWSLFDQWRKSPGHNANMLATGYLASGVGVDPLCWCGGVNYPGIMGTQMFGTGAANTGDTAMGLNFGPIPTAAAPPSAAPPVATVTKRTCKKGKKLKRGKCVKKKKKKK